MIHMPKTEVKTSRMNQRDIHYFENETGRIKQNVDAFKRVSIMNDKQLKIYNYVK